MESQFENIYTKLHNQIINSMYMTNMENIIQEYELISLNSIDFENKLLNDSVNNSEPINNNIIVFGASLFIDKLFESYKFDINKITSQFDIDFYRSELFFNGVKISDISNARKKINYYSKYSIIINDTSYNLETIIYMLCTQASFASSFFLMSKIHNDYKKDIYVISNSCKYDILNTNEIISVKLDATYYIKDILKNINLKQIKVTTVIDFSYDKYSYTLKTCKLCNLGIISWTYLRV